MPPIRSTGPEDRRARRTDPELSAPPVVVNPSGSEGKKPGRAGQAHTPARPLPPIEAGDLQALAAGQAARGKSHGGLSVRLQDVQIQPLAAQAAEEPQRPVETPAAAPPVTAPEIAPSSAAVRRAEAPPSAAQRAESVAPPAKAKRSLAARVGRALTSPVREAVYLARTFLRELSLPTRGEVLEGVAAKALPFTASAGTWGALLLPAHPVAYAAAMALSVSLETLHGVFIRSWMNFQNALGKERGLNYQSVFNLAYFQASGAAFRAISWSALPNTVPPWALEYWRDMSLVTVVGSFFGTLGYNGLNELHNKGRISTKTRDRIQQFGRDGFFLLGGMFFGTGAMSFFWPLFLLQQSIDLGLYIAGAVAKPKEGFAEHSAESDKSALRLALDAMLSTPFLAPFVALHRAIFKRGEKQPKTETAPSAPSSEDQSHE